jgi:hypothetical protein
VAPIGFRSFKPAKRRRPIFWCARLRTEGPSSEEEPQRYLLDEVRSWSAQASRPFQVPASHGRQARSTVVQLAFGTLTVLPPRLEKRFSQEPLQVWAIRVCEAQTPAGEEPLEWMLVTSVSTMTLEQAWERVRWYEHRWVVEEYHPCLKSGCRLEERQVQSADRLIRRLGFAVSARCALAVPARPFAARTGASCERAP